MTKPSYEELEAENGKLRQLNVSVRGLLQRGIECARTVVDAETMRYVGTPLTVDDHISELDEWIAEATLVSQGAESADIGKLDAADKSGARISQGLCDMTSTERFKVDCQCGTYEGNLGPCAKFSPDGMNGRCPYCHHTEDCHKKVAMAGSAETGGEKADYLLEKVTMPLYVFVAVKEFLSDWRKGDFDLSKLASLDAEAIESAIERWASDSNFRRTSQSQTASGGVVGAHEGTTADKSGSREPEKLNNAQPKCAKCGLIMIDHFTASTTSHPFEHLASPELLPTQLEEKE